MATVQQLPRLAGRIVEHQSLLAGLSIDEAQWAMQDPAQAVMLFVQAVQHRYDERMPSFNFRAVATAQIEERSNPFNPIYHGFADPPKGVRIYEIDQPFKDNFFPKTEREQDTKELRFNLLHQYVTDAEILEEFGNHVETTLFDLWTLIVRQGKGQEGPLITKGTLSNLFFIRNQSQELRIVRMWWEPQGWLLFCRPIRTEPKPKWPSGNMLITTVPGRPRRRTT